MNTITTEELIRLLQDRRSKWESNSNNDGVQENSFWWNSFISLNSSESVLQDIILYDRDDLLKFLWTDKDSTVVESTIRKSRNSKHQSALHLTVLNSSYRTLAFFREIFSSENDLDFWNGQTLWGETALHIAAGVGDTKVVQSLLLMGCDEAMRDKWSRTAADIAEETGHSNLFLDTGLAKKYLTEKSENQSTNIPLQLSQPRQLLSQEFLQAVQKKKISNNVDTHVTVKSIFTQTIDSFSNSGVVTSTNQTQTSTLYTKAAISKLLEFPVDPDYLANLCCQENWDHYDINGYDYYGIAAIHKIVSWDKVDLLEMILKHPQLDVNKIAAISQESFSALHFAIDNNAINAFHRLLQTKEMNLEIQDRKGRTPMQLAIERGLIPFVSLLQQYSVQL